MSICPFVNLYTLHSIYSPAAQAVQLAAPASAAINPAAHSSQDLAAALLPVEVPAAHLLHDPVPDSLENCPECDGKWQFISL